jgi:hypothetical protein
MVARKRGEQKLSISTLGTGERTHPALQHLETCIGDSHKPPTQLQFFP